MNKQLKNFLFLAMQKGGNVSPQMRQQSQSGQLPMMQMGNDIQKMNQRQASHYGYFQAGGQQEEIDQEYLSPMNSYSQRVSDFLNSLKEQAMGAVQDEMVQTNDAYAEEADAISGMPMAQYGAQYNQPGLDAAKAWEEASKKRTNTIEPIMGASALATGLKGYWGDDEAFAANPYNEQYIKKVKYRDIKGTEPVAPMAAPGNPQLSQTQTFQTGGQYDIWRKSLGTPSGSGEDITGGRYDDIYNWVNNEYAKGTETPTAETPKKEAPKKEVKPKAAPAATTSTTGTTATTGTTTTGTTTGTTTPTAEEVKKAEEEKKKAEADAKAKETETTEKETETTTEKDKKNVGDGYDYLRGLADPNSMQAGAIYTTDKNGNQVPMAFYDPNLRVMSTTSDFRNPLGNIFRGQDNKKRGSLKSFTVRYGTLDDGTQVPIDQDGNVIEQPPVMQSPNVNDTTGAKEVTGLKPNPSFDTGWSTGNQMPTYPGSQPVTPPGATGQSVVPSITPSAAPSVVPQNPATGPLDLSNYLPSLQYLDPNSPMRQQIVQQGMQQAPSQNAQSNAAPDMTPPNLQPNTPVQGADGNWYTVGKDGKVHKSMDKETSRKMSNYANGGSLNRFMRQYAGGGPGTSPATNLGNFLDESDQLLADQGPIDPDTGLPIESSLDKPTSDATMMQVFDDAYNAPGAIPKVGKPGKKDNRFFKNIKEAEYKFGKKNEFLAPAMMAGLDALAGTAQNRDANQKERDLRGRLAFDQIGFKVPQTSGSQGDWTVNEGYMRPNDMVPTQFTGAGPLAQMGGSFNEGDELYLDDDTINAILAAGGQIEYLD